MENNEITETAEIAPIKRTQLRYREVISRLVYHTQPIKEIAEELGFSYEGLNRIIRSPLFQIELQKELNIKQKIERDNVLQSVANSSAKKLLEAMESGKMTFIERDEQGNERKRTEKVLDGREIISIAHDALNRTGHRPPTEHATVTNTTKVAVPIKIDLGTLVINAHKKAADGTLDAPPPADPSEVIEIEFEEKIDEQ